jgi:hypothetical protein
MSFTRFRAFIVIGVLALAALVVVIVAVVRDTQGDAIADACEGATLVNAKIPSGPSEVTVKVLNGTNSEGTAADLTRDLKNRGFKTQAPAAAKKKVDDVAVVHYGPDALSSAWLLRAYFLNQAERNYDPKMKGAVVELTVGKSYRSLATPTEVNQSIKELGEIELPPGTCAKPQD